MSGMPPHVRVCPFCGVATDVAHESQEGCIAALHEEIHRMRDILATLKPAGARSAEEDNGDHPSAVRMTLSDSKMARS
jgi:hypothetical protein